MSYDGLDGAVDVRALIKLAVVHPVRATISGAAKLIP